MARYAYAPLSIEEQERRRRNDSFFPYPTTPNPPSSTHGGNGGDHLVQERMPVCVGICVLLAIVFVLSRTGVVDDPLAAQQQQQQQLLVPQQPQQQVMTTPIQPAAPAVPSSSTSSTASTTASSTASTTASTTTPPIAPVVSTAGAGATNAAASTATVIPPVEDCNCPTTTTTMPDNIEDLVANYRAEALKKTQPRIIECSKEAEGETSDACHLPKDIRYASLQQKGATIWMTGCSGAGKTTIATALEEMLVQHYGKHTYRLDGDNLRTGLTRDLTFSEADRAESVRRTGEVATLFNAAGIITLVGLISPYRADRDLVRQRHMEQGLPFYEVFLDVPVDELKNRDPKGQYAKVESGELKHFTCIDDPYEEPLHPELTLKTHELAIEESVQILFRQLEQDGILIGPPKVVVPQTTTTTTTTDGTTPSSPLPNPDGDEIIDLHVPDHLLEERKREAATLPKVLLTDIDLNWLQVIGEGWAAPLKGFMREGILLETIHFNSVLVDPLNVTGNQLRLTTPTDFTNPPKVPPRQRVNMPIPITLSCTSFTKERIEESSSSSSKQYKDVALTTRMGQTVAIMRNVEIYANRKEEIVTRMYGVIDPDHPYIRNMYMGGDYLIGGEVELLGRIQYHDGLDKYRLTAKELIAEFQAKGADTVYAFQTRNPTHAGHAYLMRSAGEDLKQNHGYKKPVLWLSPLGGWTKYDDVPLDVRVQQHVKVLEAGMTHPGGLDPDSTVMAIWPAPMVYAGPTEVQFHAKSRRSAGASWFVVGRDPAGMKGSPNAVAHPDDDLYDGDHGRYVLQNSPGIGDMKLLSFVKVMYDTKDDVMKVPDDSRLDDFISISGTKMRLLARNGASVCESHPLPTDLVQANCIPPGFMVPEGWKLVVDYYKDAENTTRWIPWSQPYLLEPPIPSGLTHEGRLGSLSFALHPPSTTTSWWHDVPLKPAGPNDGTIINMVTEIPMFMASKMEVQKAIPNNPISQDTNTNKEDGSKSPRYYTYGSPFFNYGFVPQTWEDPDMISPDTGMGGDNDPLDVIEVGLTRPLEMGSITPCRVIGSLELIDEGETDHKILCIAQTSDDATTNSIHTIEDLNRIKPGTLDHLRDWLVRYKTSDGKPENRLESDTPKTISQAMAVIEETNSRWKTLCGLDGTSREDLTYKTLDFWLDSPSCRGGGTHY